MGENEQGGMLRTVVVVGLVALIAAVVIFGITGLKASMTKNSSTAVYNVEKAGKPYQFNSNNGNVSFDSYKVGGWNGTFYRLPAMGDVPPDNWREVHVTIKANQTSVLSYDINNYDYDVPGGLKPNPATGAINDCDVLGERSVKIYEGSNAMYSDIHNHDNTLQANREYTIVAKWHNGTSRTLYEGRNESDRSAIVVGTPDGSAGSFTVTSVEGATYKMP